MKMLMECRKCKRAMELWEFLTYVEAFFIKIIAATAVPFIIAAIKNQLALQIKGLVDSSMAGLANNFQIVCPNCKEYVCWDRVLAKDFRQLNQENENAII